MKKFLIIFVLLGLCSTLCSVSYAKYVIEHTQKVAELNIDRTSPLGEVEYSTTEPTNEDVIVKIKVNEPIKEVEGWEYIEEENTIVKVYEENKTETIIITDLSGNETEIEVEVENIDKTEPIIELIQISNTNSGYENYANKTHTIIATIRIVDENITDEIDINKIDITVGEILNVCNKTLENIQILDGEIIFDLKLTDIENDGMLSIIFVDSFITDKVGNSSKRTEITTNIEIDNIAPEGSYSQEVLQSGKVQAKISANEEIRSIDGWQTEENNKNLTKEFPADVSYEIEIIDYASNKTTITIDITGATYIVLTYASHNSSVGWSYGYSDYDIAGAEAVKKNKKLKTEALAFRITGGVSKDFIKIRGYVHSYWNDLSEYGKCQNTGYKYKLKYAPSSNQEDYYTMESSNLSIIEGEEYIQIGGSGINNVGVTDYNGNYEIPKEVIQPNGDPIYPFGVSGIQIALADYSELSVVYQILVEEQGWLQPSYNGNEAMYAKDSPMSAIRIAIVPTSELDNIIKQWEKDVGTYNVDK